MKPPPQAVGVERNNKIMKNKGILLFIFVFLMSAGVVITFGFQKAGKDKIEENNSPEVSITPPSFDFGEVKLGQKAEKEFLVKNLGNRSQEILKVSTSCGCTSASVEENNLKPSEETKLKVVFDSNAHGREGLGENERVVYLRFRDQEIGEREIKIRAWVAEK